MAFCFCRAARSTILHMILVNQAQCVAVSARLVIVSTYFLVAFCAHADIYGTVVGVSDGDTITVLDDEHVPHKVRLAGIDAPEKRQAFGSHSKQSLSECAFERRVHIEGEKTDRFGRLIGKVVVDGVDCNLRQVQAGLAWHYKQYQREQSILDRRAYSEAEQKAREERRGVWQNHAPQPPWEFRRERR
jgi:endonuclease YncB( thermonuclease family)